MTSYPPLGPLLATAFDKSVGIMASRWMLFVAVVIASAIFGFANTILGYIPGELFLIYWTYAVYANAVRLENPAYRMDFGKAMTLLGVYIGVGVLTEICLLLLIIPGIYVGNRFSMSSITAVVEDRRMSDAMQRSWALTEKAFWPTLLFNIVVWLGMIAVMFLGYLLLGTIVIGVARTQPQNMTLATGLLGSGESIGFAAYLLAVGYAYQAHAIAQLYWHRALVDAAAPTPLLARTA